MENQTHTSTASAEWSSMKAYSLSAICLILGIVLGALFHGPQSSAASKPSVAVDRRMPTGQMPPGMPQGAAAAAMADPAFEKAKSEPNNFDALSQAGNAAMRGGNPKMATDYYGRALKVKDDLDVRTNLANAYFRAGDADQSLAELATVLKADPKNDKALYNTGVVKLMAKNDAKGAIASWETFLKYHPDHPHKSQVQEMIKRVKSSPVKTQE